MKKRQEKKIRKAYAKFHDMFPFDDTNIGNMDCYVSYYDCYVYSDKRHDISWN